VLGRLIEVVELSRSDFKWEVISHKLGKYYRCLKETQQTQQCSSLVKMVHSLLVKVQEGGKLKQDM
jgi:hypothetical protein